MVKSWIELLLSQDVYSQSKRGYWYNQLAMIEMKYFKQFENVSNNDNNNIQSFSIFYFILFIQAAKVTIKALEDKTLTEVARHDLSTRAMALSTSKKNKIDVQYKEKIAELVIEPPDSEEFPSVLVDARALR